MSRWRWAFGVAVAALTWLFAPAGAVEIVLDDVASDRVERQRAYARGAVPLPGTPDLSSLGERLSAKGLKLGAPLFLRVFKASSELEIWMQKGTSFEMLDTYPICHWTGTLGPKIREGDKQSPEGFYGITFQQTRLVGRWRSAFNLGFPNTHDQLLRRSGSYILMHGGCSSTGCFAMTDQVQAEIFSLVEAALNAGQKRIEMHILPFRMTDAAMQAHADSPWAGFWRDLKAGYDAFERTRIPPRVAICEQRYHVSDGQPGEVGNPSRTLTILRPQTASSLATAVDGPACQPEMTEPPREQSATLQKADLGRRGHIRMTSGGAIGVIERSRRLRGASSRAERDVFQDRSRDPVNGG